MIELKVEHDYIVGDTADWLSDISEPHEDAQASFDAFRERDGAEYYAGNDILPWLETLHDSGAWQDEETGDWHTYGHHIRPTGLYGEDKPFTAASVNEDNWLSDDIMVTLAHTAEFGDLLIWQRGVWLSAEVHVCSFNGDDTDAYSWSGGSAGHADGTQCDSEWIIESACKLWPNGGRGETHALWDLARDDEGNMLCPDHNVPLAFVGY